MYYSPTLLKTAMAVSYSNHGSEIQMTTNLAFSLSQGGG